MKLWKIALLCTALALPCADAAEAATRSHGHRAGRTHAAAHRPHRHQVARHAAHRPAHQAARHTHAAANGQRGHASIYSRRLAGRRMADGSRFDPRSDTVASRTLPLGSHARVTNLRNGRTAIVRVRDRGPHVGHRILDLSPGVAARLGMASTGTAPVSVALIASAEAATLGNHRSRGR